MSRRTLALVLVVTLFLAAVPAPVAAEQRGGGTVVVGPDETVDGDLTAFGGTVIVRGNVTGNLDVVAGSVVVSGGVGGSISGSAGTVTVDGVVGDDVTASAGSILIGENGVVRGDLSAGAGIATVAGTVRGNVRVGADEIILRSSAVVGGDVVYDAELQRESGATVGGTVREDTSISGGGGLGLPTLPPGAGQVYEFLAHLALGAVLLVAFPAFSGSVTQRAGDGPLRSLGAGLLFLVGAPVVAALTMVTVIGLPLGAVGLVLTAIALWVGFVYAGFATGSRALAAVGTTNRWAALAVGLAVLVLVDLVPIAGALVRFGALLVGVGALALAARERRSATA